MEEIGKLVAPWTIILTTVDEFKSFFPLVIITIKRNEMNELENRYDIQLQVTVIHNKHGEGEAGRNICSQEKHT